MCVVKENHTTLYAEIKNYFDYLDKSRCENIHEDIRDSGLAKNYSRIERKVLDVCFMMRLPAVNK
jgi:hypothetical protein